MKLPLTEQQAAQVRELVTVGKVILGKITFRPFDGDSTRCGELEFEFGTVPESSLPSLRAAIKESNSPGKRRKSPTKNTP